MTNLCMKISSENKSGHDDYRITGPMGRSQSEWWVVTELLLSWEAMKIMKRHHNDLPLLSTFLNAIFGINSPKNITRPSQTGRKT